MVRIGTERAALLRRNSPSPNPPSLPGASAAGSGSRLIAARRCRAGTRASGDAVFGYHNSRRTPSNKPSLFAAHEILGSAATRGPRANRHGGRLSLIHGCAPAQDPTSIFGVGSDIPSLPRSLSVCPRCGVISLERFPQWTIVRFCRTPLTQL